ncbi:hypothetical protein ABVK25_003094 [Lepraria finkii]|uniref:6,7-dimethyl-8-ribityllumazine synthase n=1 Tax=Lepraria finkii TaxID=1340010 RepID=A0ABR4BGB3_9LECA
MSPLKGPGEAQTHDSSKLRIAIVHARWNTIIISALVAGARKSLLQSGVKEENIVIQNVPGSYELPLAVQRMYASSQLESSNTITSATSAVTDLLSSASLTDLTPPEQTEKDPPKPSNAPLIQPFSAIIAIGVLIKGETMHFEYIADATSHGLMRVQLDLGVPVIFGLLTVLNEEQGMARAGLGGGGHCHGEDWGGRRWSWG